MVCQVALLLSPPATFRVILRAAPFVASLGLLVFLPGPKRRHPSQVFAVAVVVVVCLAIFQPATNNLASGAAQIAMYTAILAPLFWTSRLSIDSDQLHRVIVVLWIFNSVSCVVGVLQVHSPTLFPTVVSPIYTNKAFLGGLTFRNVFGDRVYRPSGLTDIPGGVASSGLLAVAFAAALFATTYRPLLKVLLILSIWVGSTALALSQIRSVLIVLGICLLSFFWLLFRRAADPGRMRAVHVTLLRSKLQALILFATIMVVVGISTGLSLGGRDISARLSSLTEEPASKVYYKNRGNYLSETIYTLLPQYPLGAGLGRWGMMRIYFGDESNVESPSIWVEIQWTAWLLDGGIPLIAVYFAAILLAVQFAYRTSLANSDVTVTVCAALIFAYSIGVIADCFAYPFFMSQGAMDFWLLNGALFAVVIRSSAKPTYQKRVA